ncbi:MAG: DUF1588 domain-containing protein [Myxococcota bacterium]
MIAILALQASVVGCGGLAVNGDPDTLPPPGGSLCPPDVAVFTAEVWDPVLSRDCVVCHGPGGAGAGSAFRLDPDDLEASMAGTFAVADRLLDKPTARVAHGGGAVIAEGSAAYDALAFWVGWIGGTCTVPEPVACDDQEVPRMLRRLTHDEYARTVHDLVGVDVDPASFASDPVVDGFRNDAAALVVTDLLADQYRSTAEAVSDEVDVASLVPCEVATGDATCAAAFVESFGYRAFRRPLTQDDLDRYVGLWATIAVEDGFEGGVRWVVAAMLQSPHLLYRSELGVQGDPGAFTLTGWEVATALSYTLYGTTPDAALLQHAADGDLDTPEGVAAVAGTMLADPRTLGAAADLVEVWFDLGQLDTVSRDGLTPELRDAMRQETRDVVEDVAAAGGSLADLMTTRYTIVSPLLATHYGLPGSGRVDLDGETYGGLLTHGSVLTTHGKPSGSGPIQRGVTVRERLLCEDLPPPPSNLDTSPPEVDPTLSTRERYEQHSADPACAGCHDKIDPIGFGFERYDQLGRWREDDGGHPIDDRGAIDDVAFAGPFDLAEVLLDDPRFRTCFGATWRRHATGIASCSDDPGASVGLLEPLAAVTASAGFRLRAGGPDELDTLAAGVRIEPGPVEDPEVPPGELTLALDVVDDWGAGYCADGTVTNGAPDPVVWQVRSPVDGTITNIWNATVAVDGSEFVFDGVDWNRELQPGGVATFGFCATR